MTRPRSSFILHPSSLKRRAAFTLVELLVVLSLIVLALAAAVPAFNYITGSRSTDSAENVVGAMIQRARAQAIQTGIPTGVLFFVNPADRRATMALVSQSAGEDPYANYRGWTDQSFQQAGAGMSYSSTSYLTNHDVIGLHMTDTDNTGKSSDPERYRNVTDPFTHDNTNIQMPPPGGPWNTADVTFDLVAGAGFETLPANVAVQLINDPKGQSARDRYVQTGVIIFDAAGHLLSTPYKFINTAGNQSDVARLLQLAPGGSYPEWPQTPAGSTPPIYSQIGLVLYDRSAFLNQSGASEQDFSQLVQIVNATPPSYLGAVPTSAQETAEETWLDQNTTPLFINRGNGTLLKGQ